MTPDEEAYYFGFPDVDTFDEYQAIAMEKYDLDSYGSYMDDAIIDTVAMIEYYLDEGMRDEIPSFSEFLQDLADEWGFVWDDDALAEALDDIKSSYYKGAT